MGIGATTLVAKGCRGKNHHLMIVLAKELVFWGSMVFRHAPIPRKGSGNQQQQQQQQQQKS